MNGCYHYPHYPPPPPPPPAYYPIPGGSCVKPVVNDFTDELKEKLENIEDYANNYVLPPALRDALGGVMVGDGLLVDEGGVLSVDTEKVTGELAALVATHTDAIAQIHTKLAVDIPAALAAKVDKVEGKDLSTNDFTDELKTKLEAIESGSQRNLIERILLAGVELTISETKSVDIPVATNGTHGVVMGSRAENKVFVAEDGTMEVHSISMARLVQEEGETIILGGGGAADQF